MDAEELNAKEEVVLLEDTTLLGLLWCVNCRRVFGTLYAIDWGQQQSLRLSPVNFLSECCLFAPTPHAVLHESRSCAAVGVLQENIDDATSSEFQDG